MPEFGLRACVCKHEAATCAHERSEYARQLSQAQVPGPGKSFAGFGNGRFDNDLLGRGSTYQHTTGRERGQCFVKVAQRG